MASIRGESLGDISISVLNTGGIIRILNGIRCEHGLNELIENEKLKSSANAKAEDMTLECPTNKRVDKLVAEAGYQYAKLAENVLVATDITEKSKNLHYAPVILRLL